VLTLSHLFLAAIIQGLFLICLLLFNRRGNRRSNTLLACLVGLISISLWNLNVSALALSGYWKLFDYYMWSTPFLWGPVLFLYVKSVTNRQLGRVKVVLAHLGFAIGLFLLQFPYHFATVNEWIPADYLVLFRRTVLLAFYVQIALYILASLLALKEYKYKLENNFSNLDRINLAWLRRLLFVLAALVAVDMISTVPGVILQTDLPYFTTIMLAESVTIYLIGYFSLSHHEVIFQQEGSNSVPKYENSPLGKELSVGLSQNLNDVMRESKIFQKNDLRLAELAEQIGLKPHYLSQIINEQYGQSFYEYVNTFRVNFATDALRRDRHSSIAKIATESGFNNRASFNSYFKKHTGVTPSQYRNLHQGDEVNSLNVKA